MRNEGLMKRCRNGMPTWTHTCNARHIGVPYFSDELALRRLEGIHLGQLYADLEETTRVRAVRRPSDEGAIPHNVAINRLSFDTRGFPIFTKILEFASDPRFVSHVEVFGAERWTQLFGKISKVTQVTWRAVRFLGLNGRIITFAGSLSCGKLPIAWRKNRQKES